jgi:hypothetical protein
MPDVWRYMDFLRESFEELRGAAEGEPSQKNPKMTDREQRNPEGVAGEPSQKNPE